MAETKRMHFVPRTYLQHFSENKDGKFFIHAIPKAGGNPFETNITGICVEKNLYTLPGSTEEERQFLENMYGELYEKGYPALYKLLTDDQKETITAEERYAIVSFVVSMFYRNNSWATFHGKVMDDLLERAYNLSKQNDKQSFYFEDMEISIAGKTLGELQKEVKNQDRPMIALSTAQNIFKLSRLRVLGDFISVIKTRPGFEFITNDNPVTFKGQNINRRPIPFDPTNSLWMPIDKDHLLQIQPWADQLDWKSIGRLDEVPFPGIMTSMSNNFQSIQSVKFLLGSKASLLTFTNNPNGIFPSSE